MIKSCFNVLVRHLYLLMVFFFSSLAGAQDGDLNILGSVSDPDGAAVSGARVELRGAKQRIVIADGKGDFEITGLSPGNYTMTVAANGFAVETRDIVVPSASKIEVKLSIAETALTVTAEIGQSTDRATVPQSVSVIDNNKIFFRAPATMAQAAEVEVGARMQKTSSTIGGVFIRGMAGKNVSVYVDGVRYTTSAQRGGINTFFNLNEPSNMQTVEILRGTTRAQYGSDALGGTVNMLTRTPRFGGDKAEFHGDVSARFNTADRSYGGSGMLSYGTDKLGGYVNLAARRIGTLRTANGIDTHAAVTRFLGLPSDILGERLPDTEFSQYGGAFRLNYSLTDDSQLSFYYARSQQDNGKRYDQLLGGDGNLIADLRNLMLDFGYLRFVKQNLGLFDTGSFTVSYNSQREERVNQGGQGNSAADIVHQYERTTAIGVSGFVDKLLPKRNTLVIGGDFYSESINSPAFSTNGSTTFLSRPRVPDEARYKLGGVYLQDTWEAVPERLRISGALRYNVAKYKVRASDNPPSLLAKDRWLDDNIRFSDFSGKIGAVVRLVDELRFVANYSRGFRAPSMTDLGTLGLTGDGFEIDYITGLNMGGTIGTTADGSAVSTGLPVARQRSEITNNIDVGLRYRNSCIETSGTFFNIDLNDTIVKQALILPTIIPGQTTIGGQIITSQAPGGAVFVALSTAPVLVRANYSDARIFGFEFEFNAKLRRDLRLSTNYTHVRAEDKATGLPPNIEGGTPPATGYVSLRYEPKKFFWVEFYSTLAARQDRLSSLDLGDRRTGAARSASQIANFIRRGACVRGISSNIGIGGCGSTGTGANYIINSTGETISQVQMRVVGSTTAGSTPMLTHLPGYGIMNLRGGFRVGESSQIFWSFENMLDQQYRNPSWGIDGAGRSFGAGFKYTF